MSLSSQHLDVNTDARGVATVTIQRPDVHNAFDEALIDTMTRAFVALGQDERVRVVVLQSLGKSFCAGADIGWMQRAAANGFDANLADAQRFADLMATIATCPKPVVARVQGAAYGGGVGLICAADIAVASDQARFTVSEARFGIIPAVIGPHVINAVGPRQARRLALSCELIGAQEALAMGMVQKVCPPEDLDALMARTIEQLLVAGPLAQAAIKTLFGALNVGPVDQAVQALTAQTIAEIRTTPEAREGFLAFMRKAPAPWTQA